MHNDVNMHCIFQFLQTAHTQKGIGPLLANTLIFFVCMGWWEQMHAL